MMPRARIIRGPDTPDAARTREEPLFSMRPSMQQWRRIAREELEARAAGERIVEEARSRAEVLAAQVRDDATSAAAQAVRVAREQAEASAAAQWLSLRQREGEGLERDEGRIIAVAVVLAERLLGAALDLDPARIVHLARAAMAEARGARRIAIEAHPLDANALRGHLHAAHLDAQSVEVRDNDALARGDLRLQTDVGTIDAKLAPRLDRLAAALRDAVR
jgi:flagellar biosynthesis/type III secretory pathway protein FliH